MKHPFIFLSLFLFIPLQSLSTLAMDFQPSPKIDAVLSQYWDGQNFDRSRMNAFTALDNSNRIDIWITLSDPSFPRRFLEDVGVEIRTDLGRILTAWIPPSCLPALAAIPQVAYIESSKILTSCLDRSIPESHTDQVWSQLGNGNRGNGVIVGIIDSGIDYRHGDFRTSDDRSRVLAIWDQLDESGTPPSGYSYGTYWDKNSLDQKTCTHIPRRFHGTHVAGIAAGDGSETGNGQPAFQYVGVAPEADILVVNHEDDVRDTQIVDAVNWIFQMAGSKPVSINMSFGAQYGLHDGSYTLDQALNLLVGPGKPGRVICAAVGNEGDSPLHAKTTLKSPVNKFYPYLRLSSNEDFDSAIVQVFYPAASSVQARMWIPKNENVTQYITTDWVSKNGRHVLQIESGIFQGIIVTVDAREAPYASNPNFNLITFMIDKNGQNVNFSQFGFDLELNGPGTEIDAWVAFAATGVEFTSNPNDSLRIVPDSECTISTPASAENIIGVASYVTKNKWTTVDGNLHEDSSAVIGQIAESSGRGPLRNGDRKPDLAAPGQYIVAAWETNIQPDYGNRRSQSVEDGKHFIDQGTSMASPHVCGAAALLLQKNPLLDAVEIKQFLLSSAIDAGTTGWDGRWGAGKMDVKKSWDAIASDSPTATPLPPMTPSPTPTLFLYPSPTLANSIQPSVVYEMGLNTLSENGWSEIPGGFNTAMAGITTIGLLPQNAISSSRDNRGIQIQVQESQVVFLYAQTSLQTGGSPVLVRALVRADAPMCSITLAALKGDLQSMQGVDGSIATYMPMTASGYMEKERFISLLYKPDSGEIFTPVIQVASTGTAPARVWIDRIEVYRLPAGNESPGYLFYSNWLGDDQPVATSTPLPPTAIPTPTPFSIPTYTPTFTPTWTPTPGVVPTPTATFTPPSSEGWILLAEDPQGDMDDTLFDIKQLWIRLSGAELSFRFVTYSAWPSESIRKNQGMFEIYLNTDNNLNTGYMIAGADYLLSVGTDFFTDGYVEVVSQWSDPDGFGDDFYAIMNIRRVESSNSNTLDITVNRVDIGNPTSIQIYSSIFNVDTFGLDECPDEGYAQYP